MTGAKNGESVLTERKGSCLEQASSAAVCSVVTDVSGVNVMNHHDQRYSYMTAHQLPPPPGIRYATPVGHSLQTPFDGRASASQHFGMATSQNFHCRDTGHFRPPGLNVHSMPEATPFQAIVNPLDNGYGVTHNGMTGARQCSVHVSSSRGQHGGSLDGNSFRRTPGARRSSPRAPHSSQLLTVPRPLFRPSSCQRTGPSCATHTSNVTAPLQPFSDNDLGRTQSVRTAPSYPAAIRSRSKTEPLQFDAGSSLTDGVELVVSNLDYNISSHEWKKILTCELQQQVQVYGTFAVQFY